MSGNSDSPRHPKTLDEVFPGQSEMAAVLGAIDWSATPIGPVSSWSPALRMMVPLLLMNRFPLLLWWGPEYVQLYNDAYAPIPGKKHPRSAGQRASECWVEIWDILEPLIDRPFNGGAATWVDDLELEIDRYGFTEETHFTVAYSPVPDPTAPAGIGGVLATVHEITQQVCQERRVRTLRDLGARAVEARTAEEACSIAADVFRENARDTPFALLYLLDEARSEARLAATAGVVPGAPCAPAVVARSGGDKGWPLAQVLSAQELIVVDDLASRFGEVPRGPWSDPPYQAVVMPIPSALEHRLAGMLVLGVSARLALDELYRSFFELAAAQVATAISSARAYEEEKRRAEALAELDRAKTAFFSNVSHEFRTPLTLMLGPLEDALAGADETLGPRNTDRLEIAHRNSLRLLKLVNTLLDFSRIEAGRIQATYEQTDIGAYTEELASAFRSAVERAGLSLTVDRGRVEAPVFVDREMWEKVVLNLLSNAFKFTFEGGISVSVREQGDHVAIAFRDTGAGIPPEELPRVFDRFHRVKGVHGRTHEGTGIGLSLVQELVKLHGGTVAVESELGKGTTFTVTVPTGRGHLPAERVNAARTIPSTNLGSAPYLEEALRWLPDDLESGEPLPNDDARSVRVSTAGARVLIADDNQDMREYLRRLLSAHWRVEAVADGAAALAAIRTRPPDLVLADVMMPSLDGFELLAALRADPATRMLPVLLVSARAGEEARVEGLNAGADDYLTKPFSARELLARVNSHLELARVRREADARVRESEARFRALAESSAALVWAVDQDGNAVYANPRYLEFFGKSFEEMRGFGLDLVVDAEENPDYFSALMEARERREAFQHRVRVKAGDGAWRWLETHARPFFDGQGDFAGHVGISLDITDIMESSQALRESEERFRTLADSAPALIWVNDLDGCEFMNRGYLEFLGVNPADVRGYDWAQFVHPEDRDAYVANYLRAMEQRTAFEEEFRFRRHDGEYRSMRSVGLPRIGQNGDLVGFAGLTLDVTERKRAEDALREADRRKDEFLAMLAHELRNPLASIVNACGLLAHLGPQEPQLIQARDIIERQTGHLTRLVDDLLDVSRITRGTIVLQTQLVALEAVMAAALEVARPAIERLGHAVTVSHSDESVQLEGDFARLVQAVSNLLTNAAKFTPVGGRITVSTGRTDGNVAIRVRDTGVGIPPALQEKIFDLFVQEESGLARTQGGMGIGLTLVRRVIDLHGGTVAVRSDGAGHGSEFTITLPALPASAAVLPNPPREPQLMAASKPLRILLVEDNHDAAESFSILLGLGGHDVRVAHDGAVALATVEGFSPDVAFIDVGLPGIDGYELAPLLRAHPRCRGSMLIALTGYGREDDKRRASQSGFDHHMTKPVDLAAIDRLLSEASQMAGAVRAEPRHP